MGASVRCVLQFDECFLLQCEKEREREKSSGEDPSPSELPISCFLPACLHLDPDLWDRDLLIIVHENTQTKQREEGSASLTQHSEIRLLCNSEICNLHVNNPWAQPPWGALPALSASSPRPVTYTSLHLTANIDRTLRGRKWWREEQICLHNSRVGPSVFQLWFLSGFVPMESPSETPTALKGEELSWRQSPTYGPLMRFYLQAYRTCTRTTQQKTKQLNLTMVSLSTNSLICHVTKFFLQTQMNAWTWEIKLGVRSWILSSIHCLSLHPIDKAHESSDLKKQNNVRLNKL